MSARAALLAMLLALAGCGERAPDPALRGDAARGRIAVTQYACTACHMVPGVTGSEVYVGRPLKGLADRKFIAGRLPNTQENLMKWIRNPRAVDPLTAMPVMDVSETDARDISAYLLSRR
ncbi:MAG: c-type cytochrome [Telluria sp.]